MNKNQSLLAKVTDGCSSVASWVAEAAASGFETTVDELRSTCERLVGKPISLDSLVGELRSLFASELSEDQLAGAVGGALPLTTALTASSVFRLPALSGYHIQDSGPTWVNSPSIFNLGSISFPGL
jgi:hypothetical protein